MLYWKDDNRKWQSEVDRLRKEVSRSMSEKEKLQELAAKELAAHARCLLPSTVCGVTTV